MSKRTYNSVYYVDKYVHTYTRPCMCGVDTVLQLLAGTHYPWSRCHSYVGAAKALRQGEPETRLHITPHIALTGCLKNRLWSSSVNERKTLFQGSDFSDTLLVAGKGCGTICEGSPSNDGASVAQATKSSIYALFMLFAIALRSYGPLFLQQAEFVSAREFAPAKLKEPACVKSP